MKKLLALLGVALVVFVAVYRQRIYVWDMLANVTRDGVKQSGVRVMINYSNDVLLDDNSGKTRHIYLLQHWNNVAQYSAGPLRCVEYLACMTDADHATGEPVNLPSTRNPTPSGALAMTNKQATFVDDHGAAVLVTLR